ncbi:MAG TPA: phenylacetate--CoA ligase family protein [Candidatus Dormibacteraeota bacterium]
MTSQPGIDKTGSSAGRLKGDTCDQDWIWDRDVETASPADQVAAASSAWDVQLQHLAEGSRFYARKFKDAGIGSTRKVRLADITELPFTTKDELKQSVDEQPPFGTNAGVDEARIKRVYQTSGTTGTPTVIPLTRRDMDTWTTIGARTYYATGIHNHHSVLTTFGAGPFVAGHTHFVLTRIDARAVPVAPGDTGRVLIGLKSGLADTLLSTPSFAQYLANKLEGSRPDPASLRLTHVVTGGEPGGGIPAIRDHIERVLGATVTEVMGIGDVAPSLFGECPQQNGMHFCGTGHVWPELIDPKTKEPMVIETGAVGELVYTHLTRDAMPVVRFLSGDIVRIEGTSCECGRTSFRMRCLARRDDMFIVRGVNVYPSAILAVVGDFRPRVTGRARVVRRDTDVSVQPPVPVEVEVPDASRPDPQLAAALEEAIHTRLTFRCQVELVPEGAFGASAYKTNLTVTRQ